MKSTNKSYRLSKWCKIVEFDDTAALYHTLSLAVIYLTVKAKRMILDKIRSGHSFNELCEPADKEIAQELVREKMIVAVDYDEMEELLNLRESLLKDITLEMMYLILTDNCNLKCRYCFEDAPVCDKTFKSINMSKTTAIKAVDAFARLVKIYGSKDKKKIIHLYGGEPLLNFGVIRAVVSRVSQLKRDGSLQKDCSLILITNGTLINKEIADFFLQNDISVGLSLDGPKNLNNLYRIAKKNSVNVFQKTREAYDLFKNAGVQVGVSATLTPEVIENFDEVLSFFIDELKIQDGMSFNILHYNPAVAVDTKYFELAAETLIKAYKRFRELGIYEERMMRKVITFINKKPMLADCGVIGNQIVVAPDGKVGVCQDFVKPRMYFQGTVYDENYDPIKSGLFEEWKKRSPLFMEQCYDCEALGICGGGCPASVELKTGSRWNIDERICPHSKVTLRWLLRQTYLNNISQKSCRR